MCYRFWFACTISIGYLSENAQNIDKNELASELSKFKEYVNSKIEKFENIKKIVVVNDEWSVHSNILTPTLKIKRNIVETKYRPFEDKWINESSDILFH